MCLRECPEKERETGGCNILDKGAILAVACTGMTGILLWHLGKREDGKATIFEKGAACGPQLSLLVRCNTMQYTRSNFAKLVIMTCLDLNITSCSKY